ncbi:predicted protein [Sclerotinia sclerotiorum 1980 UF-70]|uniref:Uncharacterized protein n=1 Tax=Sclerotinia sclerotiorum (strain ATCC 18683 / 1980 / Ss-1) TaxID=665079 RepID=A7END3_SCLS1|nr:predicted protein [Sclerotinia sclerotiorum 1980 UF-70]EDO04349.1 predicted protein [Sclerotinia sclerotiorum 1980 UF-70]
MSTVSIIKVEDLTVILFSSVVLPFNSSPRE